jgi:hypothetical protein
MKVSLTRTLFFVPSEERNKMLYQTDRGWLDDKTVEKMLEPLTEAGRQRVRDAIASVENHLKNRKDWKGLGRADLVVLTFNDTEMDLADRAVLRWILQESCSFTVHMEYSQKETRNFMGGGEARMTNQLQLVLMW